MTKNLLEIFREKQDVLADKVFAELHDKSFNFLKNDAYQKFEFNNREIPEEFPEVLKSYFSSIKDENPYKKEAYQSGFFEEYQEPIMICLGLASLPYCYAAAHGAQVLYLSERLKSDAYKRLNETAVFVLDVCSKNAFSPQGKALVSIAKVRLMHAAIRFYIDKSGKWQQEWGAAINQEDMSGTNLSFSLIVIRAMRNLGYPISSEQAWQYISHWNKIGQLLGIASELLPENNKEAFVIERLIAQRQFRPSKEGKELTASLMKTINDLQAEFPLPFSASSMSAFLLGEEVSKTIGLDAKDFTSDFVFKNIGFFDHLALKISKGKQSIFRQNEKVDIPKTAFALPTGLG